jgi:thioesterase domain-containing protein
VGGTVFSFNSILDTMPSWCPVWGLPYPGISGESKPARRVEELVDRFLAAAADHVPQNPVLLGYSFGAFIAFEMARKLKERGVDPIVVVIDAVPASLDRFEPRTRKIKIPKDWKLRMEHVFPKAIADAMGLKRSRSMKHLRDVIAGSFEAMRN